MSSDSQKLAAHMDFFKIPTTGAVGTQDREHKGTVIYVCAATLIIALSALALVLAIAALVVGAIGLHGNRPFSDCHIQTFTEAYVAHTSDTTFEYVFDTPAYNANRTGYYVTDMHCEAEETVAHTNRPLIATLRRRGQQVYCECAIRPNINVTGLPFPLIYDNAPSAYLWCSLVITRCAQTL